MPSVVALSFMVLSSIVFSITLIIVCGKRKLYQRKECSRRDPHVPGQEAQKTLKREIERRITRVAEISYEPKLIQVNPNGKQMHEYPPHYFRMKTLDNMKYLETELGQLSSSSRCGKENIRSYLMNMTNYGNLLCQVEARVIHELCDLYDSARHHPTSYGPNHFTEFHALLLKILHTARKRKNDAPTSLSSSKFLACDRDSAIDESGDDSPEEDGNLFSGTDLVFVRRPKSLGVREDEDYETPL